MLIQRSLIGGAMLLASAGCATADWVQWSADPQQKITFYYAPASIKRTGNFAQMSILIDFGSPMPEGGKLYSSLVEQDEYDCAATRQRVIQATWHADRMGRGEGTASPKKPSGWVEMSEDLEKRAWKLACRK